MRRVVTIVLLLHLYALLFGQATYRVGILPDIVASHALDNRHRVLVHSESRVGTAQQHWLDQPGKVAYDLTDFSVLLSRRLSATTKTNVGYLARLVDSALTHRLIQQYTYTSARTQQRISHRWVTDQTYRPDKTLELRARYRIAGDRPLIGDKIDVGEYYFKWECELLLSVRATLWSAELRVVPAIGYVPDADNKIELALDIRQGRLLLDPTTTTSWLKLNWYTTIDP